MSDASKPLIVVAGATSKQGRSVVTSLLDSGRFRVRALTRSADSVQAKSLAEVGAQVVTVPLEPGISASSCRRSGRLMGPSS